MEREIVLRRRKGFSATPLVTGSALAFIVIATLAVSTKPAAGGPAARAAWTVSQTGAATSDGTSRERLASSFSNAHRSRLSQASRQIRAWSRVTMSA